MAQKVQVLLIDDLDGVAADETVTFAVDGVTYEIDLTEKNAEKFRTGLSGYMTAGRRTAGRQTRGTAAKTPKASSSSASPDTAKIREWAKKKGYEINDRGRVPATIREAYEKAHA